MWQLESAPADATGIGGVADHRMPAAGRDRTHALRFALVVGALALALSSGMAFGPWSTPLAASVLTAAIALMVASMAVALVAQRAETAGPARQTAPETFLTEASEAAFIVDHNGRIEGANAHFAALAAIEEGEALHRDLSDILPGPIVEAMTLALEHGLDSTGAIECENRIGEWLIVEVARRHGVATGGGFSFVMRDLTEARRREIELATLAFQDSLTHLGNRAAVKRRLARLENDLAEGPEASYAVMALDLDRFKQINDRFGHAGGDALLLEIASRISHAAPRNAFVGRNGGDEFIVVVGPRATYSSARQVARQIADAVGRPILLESGPAEVGVSIGVALAPAHGHDPARLLADADAAMYRAKRAGVGVAFVDDITDELLPQVA